METGERRWESTPILVSPTERDLQDDIGANMAW